MRTARRNGLKVRYAHGSAFVFGDDWFDYLDRTGRDAYQPDLTEFADIAEDE